MGDVITIEAAGDWDQKLGKRGLSAVVDPMVFRAGDVFLRGARGASKDPKIVWPAFSANLDSFVAFIDSLVLQEQLPIFDYRSSFPEWEPTVDTAHTSMVDFCNQDSEVLVPVTVGYSAYWELKQAALAELAEHPGVPPHLATQIVAELSDLDYQWRPVLGDLAGNSEDERLVATFLYGGLLFSGYAQQLGGEHIVNPKRSVHELALAGVGRAVGDDEPWQTVERLAAEAPGELTDPVEFPDLPSFLPYLLTKDPATPQKLIEEALKLRGKGPVKEYRGWRKELAEERNKGRRALSQRAELAAIRSAVEKEFRTEGRPMKITISLLALTIPKVTIEGEVAPRRVFGWALRNLPGHRYQKLLMRMQLAEAQYESIDAHLSQVWQAG